MNIKEFYEESERQHLTILEQSKQTQLKCKQEMGDKALEKSALVKERTEKKRRMTEAEEEGLDTSKLKVRIEELDAQIANCDSQLAELQKRHDEAGKIEEREFQRERLLTEIVVDVYKCGDAADAANVNQMLGLLPVKITRLDDSGRPVRCAICVDAKTVIELNIEPAGYFVKQAKPAVLKWLPQAAVADEENECEEEGRLFVSLNVDWTKEPRLRVFFDENAKRFVLSDTKLSWRTKRTRRKEYNYNYREEEYWEDVAEDFSDLCLSLHTMVAESIKAENGELRLEKDYSGNPTMAHIQKSVKEQTTTKPLFTPVTEPMSSVEIFTSIREDWKALAKSNWSDQLGGSLALLKFYVEKQEEVRFWSKVFEGHYGFRLRTRDHDWITGEIYIAPSGKKPKDVREIQIVKRGAGFDRYSNRSEEPWIASCGRMHLFVRGTSTRE